MRKNQAKPLHEPVLLIEAIESLHVKNGGFYLDATVGPGGHAIEILKKGGVLLALDADSKTVALAQKNLAGFREQVMIVQANFSDCENVAKVHGFRALDGALFDLGLSSVHYDHDARGFSYRAKSNPLDMRLDTKKLRVTAADLLNALRQDQLLALFNTVLTKAKSRRLAQKIVLVRAKKPFKKVTDFLEISQNPRLPFLALRMAVNSELVSLSQGLEGAWRLLVSGGRIVIISFHSGEDKVVKNFARQHWGLTLSKPVLPSRREIELNPRARSAKLRVLVKK